ncbi:hypothetical protein LCGC14_1975740 [marine sediment metagenome]|uniref:tRNA pseudouridine synthase A n=2 Tax=root TaxID=1 RepID=A0A831VX98_9FLAO|nr:tRNA pseudouridine(38-40) synthase TruA [Pricia antarctica]
MRQKQHTYLIGIQYLGFRYSGWQIQPGHRTIEGMLSKTLKFIMPDETFKILGAGRTDSKVSALHMAFELFLKNPIVDFNAFLNLFNQNLPPDIRALTLEPITQKFNIIKDAKTKEYVYLFSYGAKNHPFCAPFLANIQEVLNIELMKKAARLFEGSHDFLNYTVKDKGNSETNREILSCVLQENSILSASFFPAKSYALHIKASGFLRYQIRMIMGALIQLGKGDITLNQISASLNEKTISRFTYIAPGSGLHLNQLEFKGFEESFIPE